ncbi:MAG: hypothetical protein SchgKO_11620 [Schleiferiaceae bacterium]
MESAENFQVDYFGNSYVINANTLRAFTVKGKAIGRYAAQGSGDISWVDSYNPLNVIVYYQDNSTLVFLDNQLNAQQRDFDPTWSGFQDVNLVCGSDDNSVWFFDRSLNQLVKWDLTQEKALAASPNLRRIRDVEFNTSQLISSIDRVLLSDPDKGIMVFDMTGSFEKWLPIPHLNMSLTAQFITYQSREGKWFQYDIINGIEQPLNPPPGESDRVKIRGDFAAVWADKNLKIYRKIYRAK